MVRHRIVSYRVYLYFKEHVHADYIDFQVLLHTGRDKWLPEV